MGNTGEVFQQVSVVASFLSQHKKLERIGFELTVGKGNFRIYEDKQEIHRCGSVEEIDHFMRGFDKAMNLEVTKREKLVELAAETTAGIYGRSVFPEMGVNWETHPNNIGHEEFPGCSRCHDGELATADEIFLTGTAAEIDPVTIYNDAPVGDGKAGQLTTKLKELYSTATRAELDGYDDWNTFVDA